MTEDLKGYKLHTATYLGQVVDNDDPDNINRVLVVIPELDPNGTQVFKALPKGMVAGKGYGFNYTPTKGDYVYITFRLGLLKFPLWEPGYWAIGEKPEEFTKEVIGMKFRDGSVMMFNEARSEFTLMLNTGDYVSLKDNILTLSINKGPYINLQDENITVVSNNRKLTVGPDGIKVKNELGEDYVAKADATITGLVNSNTALLTFLKAFVTAILTPGLPEEAKAILTTSIEALELTIANSTTFQQIKTT